MTLLRYFIGVELGRSQEQREKTLASSKDLLIIHKKRKRSDGKRKNCDQKDRQFNKQASDFLKEKERIVEEGEGVINPLRC
ncbi:hypothetical protein DITRI_Ditri08aG0095300 [Diplodiscus trichospermus]